jgi:hypothetical protein
MTYVAHHRVLRCCYILAFIYMYPTITHADSTETLYFIYVDQEYECVRLSVTSYYLVDIGKKRLFCGIMYLRFTRICMLTFDWVCFMIHVVLLGNFINMCNSPIGRLSEAYCNSLYMLFLIISIRCLW